VEKKKDKESKGFETKRMKEWISLERKLMMMRRKRIESLIKSTKRKKRSGTGG
jgi:hypothetical protein